MFYRNGGQRFFRSQTGKNRNNKWRLTDWPSCTLQKASRIFARRACMSSCYQESITTTTKRVSESFLWNDTRGYNTARLKQPRTETLKTKIQNHVLRKNIRYPKTPDRSISKYWHPLLRRNSHFILRNETVLFDGLLISSNYSIDTNDLHAPKWNMKTDWTSQKEENHLRRSRCYTALRNCIKLYQVSDWIQFWFSCRFSREMKRW